MNYSFKNLQTLRTFLEGMIERDSGHVVGIASLAAKFTIPFAVSYCTTKFGLSGLYSSLYDELCVLGKDKSIKTSTVYAGFINTQKQLGEVIDPNIPMMEPEKAAEKIVRGILLNHRNIYVPAYSKHLVQLR